MALGWLWWRAWFPVDAVDAAALRVAGLALVALWTLRGYVGPAWGYLGPSWGLCWPILGLC